MTPNDLSPAEARVLGVLVEKQRSVPDTYPLTLNALVAGCNQKTSRDPVMALTDADVQAALDALKHRSLVVETSGGRVMRYAHNMERALAIPAQSAAILAALLLRGPQTPGELRINTDRMHRFADISAVEGFLHELATHPQRPLVAELPRSAGTREVRWMHLLGGPAPRTAAVTLPALTEAADASLASAVAKLEEEIGALRDEIATLRRDLEALHRER
jgi:uncharacterized protein YceH (UPF0502 family)